MQCLVAGPAEKLLVMVVEGTQVQPDAAVDATYANLVVGLAVVGDNLEWSNEVFGSGPNPNQAFVPFMLAFLPVVYIYMYCNYMVH